jgi:hypothetical protein
MLRFRFSLAAALVVTLLLAPCSGAQDTPQPAPLPDVKSVSVTGASQLGERDTLAAVHVRVGKPLPEPPESLARAIERHYRGEGYTFARATAAFDEGTGLLTITIDEGVIGGVEFVGVRDALARRIAEDFALRAGDVFNLRRAREALTAALLPTRGAVTPGLASDTSRQRGSEDGRTFDMVDRNGRRVLVVGLHERDARFRMAPDFGDREDWFTPVDGLVPALGFGIVAFDHASFNHTFIAGHVSFKAATGEIGWTLGVERPLFSARRLYLGAELRDLTSSDDTWQVTSNEASLDAIGARKSYRDYYGRRGVQIIGAWRVDPHVEIIGAWRGEHERPLSVESDFSFFNGDEAFRPNRPARDGQLYAIVVGASVDGVGFERESLEATYRRHQLGTMFGERLPNPEKNELSPIWRIDWTSEISTPALSSAFDFRRHIVSARVRKRLPWLQAVGARAIGGWSEGILPPQRQFSAGGIGSVHGYTFKQQVGDTLALVNLEYSIGWSHGLRALGFFDVGRARAPAPGPMAPATPWLKGLGFGFALGRDDDFRVDFGYPVGAGPSPLQVLVRFGRTW